MDEFERLKDLPVPPPRADARTRAMEASLAAFDSEQEKSVADAQGKSGPVRPISTSRSETWRSFMRLSRPNFATAASVAALMIALPIGTILITRN